MTLFRRTQHTLSLALALMLGLLLLGRAHAWAQLPGGGEIKVDTRPLIYQDNELIEASTQQVRDRYFNAAHCVCGAANLGQERSFGLRLSLEGGSGNINRPADLWFGTQCDNDTSRPTTCRQEASGVADVDILITPTVKEFSLIRLMEPITGMCQASSSARQFWVLVDGDGNGAYDYNKSASIPVDTEAPPVPPSLRVEGGEQALNLIWDAPTERPEDVEYYQALCATMDGMPAKAATEDSPALTARYQTPRMLCAAEADVVIIASDSNRTERTGPSPVDASPIDASPTAVDAPRPRPDAATSTSLPAGLARVDPSYLCGEVAAGQTSMRINGLKNDVPVQVVLLAIDKSGNVAGVYQPELVAPQPVTDFWEDLHERGSEVEGGFCLLATTYGDDSWLTRTLRAFRDDTLARSAGGRWLIDAYYRVSGRVSPSWILGNVVGRTLVAVALAPAVVIALAWHGLGLGATVLLMALVVGWLTRRRRILASLPKGPRMNNSIVLDSDASRLTSLLLGHVPTGMLPRRASSSGRLGVELRSTYSFEGPKARPNASARHGSRRWARSAAIGTAALIATATPAAAQGWDPYWSDSLASEAAADTLPRWHVGLRFGPYLPGIDKQLGGTAPGPFEEMFGGARVMPVLDVDWFFFRRFGQLGVGGSLGYFGKSAKTFTQASNPGDMDRERADDTNAFRLLPLTATLVYRFTYLDDALGVPLVPYVRGGLAYYVWWVSGPGGSIAQTCPGRDTMCADSAKLKAAGASLGYQGSVGLALRAERVDSNAARSMRESGIFHAGFYAELQMAKVDGFGKAEKLSVGDNTWFVGADFEF